MVQGWQAVAPAVVEYLPVSQAWQASPTRRKPALQILGPAKTSVSARNDPCPQPKNTHQGHALAIGVRVAHETYWVLLAGLFVQAVQAPAPVADL